MFKNSSQITCQFSFKKFSFQMNAYYVLLPLEWLWYLEQKSFDELKVINTELLQTKKLRPTISKGLLCVFISRKFDCQFLLIFSVCWGDHPR